MGRLAADAGLAQQLYGLEETLSGLLAPLGVPFSPVSVSGGVGDPGMYNLPDLQPVTTEAATYAAGGAPVSDAYTGITLYNMLDAAGGLDLTSAKNDALSKFVVATGTDGLARMVVPGDHAGGRYVSNLVDLRVVDLTAPMPG